MFNYTDCKTVKTGLYKPHTIYLGGLGVSIVYYSKEYCKNGEHVAIATDTNGNKYDILKTKSIYGSIGFLAFPVNPDSIKGFYPYL